MFKVLQVQTFSTLQTPNECPGYNTKQSDGEVPVMLEPWGIRSTSSLPLFPGPLWPGMVAPEHILKLDKFQA